ncbi:hypothetical protein [Pseudomonas sp. UBA4194]|uniref:hypothetical protein n=1 Tax=Pseudomonas sp. UBA4194 TaxID=1947317 RepID=UPI0025DEA1E7|nr:hypothetical protein [Pseudomonas sp. UBA4194]
MPEAIPGHPQNLIPASKNNAPFKIAIPFHTSMSDGDAIQLMLDDAPVNVPPLEVAELGGEFVREFPADLAHGIYNVTYEVKDPGGNVVAGTPQIKLRIDRVAPGGTRMPTLVFAPEVIAQGITRDKLVPNASGDPVLKVTLPDYFGMEDFDEVKPHYRATSGGAELIIAGAQKIVPAGGAGTDLELEIPLAGLQAMNDGVRWFGYTLTDLAGNISSGRADEVELAVVISDAPVDADLALPDIALFSDDGLISEADARTPVRVRIPQIPKALGGDEVIFYLGTSSTSRLRIDTADLAKPFVLEFDLPYDFVANGGGTGSPQRYTDEGYYEIYRGVTHMASSGANPVAVDITVAPGPDPNPGTPENELLRVLTVVADSGATDIIDSTDLEKDAKVIIPFFADTATPPGDNDYLRERDVITVYWNGVALADRYTIAAGDELAKLDLQVTATSAEMKAGRPGMRPVHYTVTRAVSTTPPVNNVALAFAKDVQVISMDLLPGGPGGLPAAEFTERTPASNSLNKAQLEDGTPFRVLLDYANVAVGDKIKLTLQGYYGMTGSGTPTPNTTLVLDYDLTEDDMQHLPGGPVKVHDFDIAVSYFSKKWVLEPVGRGSVTAVYSIDGEYGEGGPSTSIFVRIYAVDL